MTDSEKEMCPNCNWNMRYIRKPVKFLDFEVDLIAWHCIDCHEYFVGRDQTKDLQRAYKKHQKGKK